MSIFNASNEGVEEERKKKIRKTTELLNYLHRNNSNYNKKT